MARVDLVDADVGDLDLQDEPIITEYHMAADVEWFERVKFVLFGRKLGDAALLEVDRRIAAVLDLLLD